MADFIKKAISDTNSIRDRLRKIKGESEPKTGLDLTGSRNRPQFDTTQDNVNESQDYSSTGESHDTLEEIKDSILKMMDIGGQLSSYGDDIGDEIVEHTDDNNMQGILSVMEKLQDREQKEQIAHAQITEEINEEDIYQVTNSGALGSERGPQVERALARHVMPLIYPDGRTFEELGGSRIKTDIRDSQTEDGYTVKASDGGVEANNAGFNRFFELWGQKGLDLDSPAAAGIMKYFGIPVSYAQDVLGIGDELGQWNKSSHGYGNEGIRQTPLQMINPGIDFNDEELKTNAFHPERIREQFPEEYDGMMSWLESQKPEIMRTMMRQRDNDLGESGLPDQDYDENPANVSAFYHLTRDGKGPHLKGELDLHDISDENVARILENPETRWQMANNMTGGLRLNTPNSNHRGRQGGRGSITPLMTLTRKANNAGGGRYGNGFHSPRFGFTQRSFDAYPEIAKADVEMTMGAPSFEPIMNERTGQPRMRRNGEVQQRKVPGNVIPESVKVDNIQKGSAWNGD